MTAIECHACGHEIPATETACGSCTLCSECCPAACICKEGARLRREDAAEADWAWFREITDARAVAW